MMTNEMVEYRAMAEGALRESRLTGRRRVVSNRGPQHAAAVTSVLVTNADQTLSFLCGNFSRDVFNIADLRAFLAKPGTVLSVLLDQPSPNAGSILGDLRDFATGETPRLRVRRLAHPCRAHMGLADGANVRLESDTASRQATVIFGDRDFARSAVQRFDALWSSATEVAADTL